MAKSGFRTSVSTMTKFTRYSLNLYVFVISIISTYAQMTDVPISNSCKNSLMNVTQVNGNACLDISTLIPLISTPINVSWIPTIDRWLNGVCKRPRCSNDTIEEAFSGVLKGCHAELAFFGMTEDEIAKVTADVVEHYNLFRAQTCLIDTTQNSTWCVTELLHRVEDAFGRPLNGYTVIPYLVSGGLGRKNDFNITCTDCARAMYAVGLQNYPAIGNDTTYHDIAIQQCGPNFFMESYPTSIQDGSYEATISYNPTTSSTNHATLFATGWVSKEAVALVALMFSLTLLV